MFKRKLKKYKKYYMNIGILIVVTLIGTFIQSPLAFSENDVPTQKQKQMLLKESNKNDPLVKDYSTGDRKIRDDVKENSTLSTVKLPVIKVEIIEKPNYIFDNHYITNIAEIPKNMDGIQTKEIGEFKVSAFCNCKKCKNNINTKVKYRNYDGVNAAVDPSIIPYGTKIYIDGLGIRQAQPNSQKVIGKEIKVYVKNHADVIRLGTKNLKVYKVF
ncbi:3D domain-containing protein [Clostridioides difficile]|uniref:3D domain-containing protein n=1 Tax=Clostridioides difficile TaxID=1496 RepID=UPI001033AEF9|nr:3D domain-containing protein [Clostridioides difficile]